MPKTTKQTDTEYEDTTIKAVDAGRDGYSITRADGWSFYLPNATVEPHVGDTARFYGRGIGSIVRGVDVNGVEVFYRTPGQQAADDRREARKARTRRIKEATEATAQREADYAALPYAFQQRIDRFRRTNPDFWWEFEGYELFACAEAVKVARSLGSGENIAAFHALSYDEQRERVPELDYDNHSGNTFGAACFLARLYLTDEVQVVAQHGALCPLVGCTAYGCVGREQATEATHDPL